MPKVLQLYLVQNSHLLVPRKPGLFIMAAWLQIKQTISLSLLRAVFFGDVIAAGVPGLTNAVGICPWGPQMPGNSFGRLWLVMITLDILGILVGTAS